MSVIKVRIQKDFTVLCNSVLENLNLSFKAKGLWAYCMSRPDNWQFHVNHLATVSKDGVDAVYSALAELKEAGLVEYVQPNKGKFEKAEYIIYPYPQDFKISLPQRGFPDAGSSDAKNPALTSTDYLTSKETNKFCSVQEGAVPPQSSEIRPKYFSKKNAKGEFLKFDESEVFTFALKSHPDWTTEEIEYALDAAWKCKGPINSVQGFLEGTIKKNRNKQNFEKMEKAKCSKKEENPQKNTSQDEEKKARAKSSDKRMSPDMLKQLFPGCC